MKAIADLLTSGQPWLVAIGVLALAAAPFYLYVREIRRQRDDWIERWETKSQQLEEVKESRLEEMKDTKQALKESVQATKKFQEELQKQRERRELMDELIDEADS